MRKPKIMLDAGHGGIYSGAVNGKYLEKDLTLLITIHEKELFENAGCEVLLTRCDDNSVELKERTDYENKMKPDIFISNHMDGANQDAKGCTVWLHSQAPISYIDWGADIVNGIKKSGCSSNRYQSINKGYRGNANVDYAVNRDTNAPSCLIEYGFITNNDNLNEFLEHYKKYAQAVVNATCKFLGHKLNIQEMDYKSLYIEEKAKAEKAEKAETQLIQDIQAVLDKYN